MKPGFSKILNMNAKSTGCLSKNTISGSCKIMGFTDLVIGTHQQFNDKSSLLETKNQIIKANLSFYVNWPNSKLI